MREVCVVVMAPTLPLANVAHEQATSLPAGGLPRGGCGDVRVMEHGTGDEWNGVSVSISAPHSRPTEGEPVCEVRTHGLQSADSGNRAPSRHGHAVERRPCRRNGAARRRSVPTASQTTYGGAIVVRTAKRNRRVSSPFMWPLVWLCAPRRGLTDRRE
ncbi:hypothetical protein [uncultured Duncaniella sp.]|uniref:hypothetical protein n=2 Tax=uncultured Duncaniella sp. TaxID=2768039 RepID=UPI00272A8D36|nr:hypothetical protein [uncultured Duncaniella sp.]